MAFDITTLDAPFAALKAFDWGSDPAPLSVIDAAVVAAHAEKPLRDELEKRLTAILGAGPSRAAKEYACRKLMLIGTATSVPALAPLLGDKDLSHMARFALERIPGPEASAALRQALGTVSGDLVIGMISSVAARGDQEGVAALAKLLTAAPQTASAAALALGRIHSPEAMAALTAADLFAANGVGRAVLDARLACAEALLAAGKKAEAEAVYRALAAAAKGKPQAKAAELAATRGLLACLDSAS